MKKLNYVFIAAILWSSVSRADPSGVHGMLLFGDKSAYVSHLPMFHSPHDYQLLLKVSLLDQRGSKTVAAYEEAKKNTSEYFTLVPESMDLTEIISGVRTVFSAAIYKGHFERGGQSLGLAQVHVEQIIFSKKLNPQASQIENSYFVFGETGEYFAAHLIQGKPSYDAILAVSQPYKLQEAYCRLRYCPEPKLVPIPDQQLALTLMGPSKDEKIPSVDDSLGEFSGVLADVKKVIYHEENDLAE